MRWQQPLTAEPLIPSRKGTATHAGAWTSGADLPLLGAPCVPHQGNEMLSQLLYLP
jgi:hypothetical protein